MKAPLPLAEVFSDRRFVVLGEIFLFNLTLMLLVRPQGFFVQPKGAATARLLDVVAFVCLGLLLVWSAWLALVLNR